MHRVRSVLVAGAVMLVAGMLVGLRVGAASPRSSEAKQATGRREITRFPGPRPDLPFSAAVQVDDTLYLAGTLGLDPKTGQPPQDPRAEARLVMDGIRKKLTAAALTMDDLVSVQVFCSDVALYDDFNAVYRAYFKKVFPARAFIGSGKLLRNARFEVQGIAVRR